MIHTFTVLVASLNDCHHTLGRCSQCKTLWSGTSARSLLHLPQIALQLFKNDADRSHMQSAFYLG